jgi:hypothetical protein
LSHQLVAQRIQCAVLDGYLTPNEGQMYESAALAGHASRGGLVHLAGYRPDLAVPQKVGHLLSIWGGEGINMAWHTRSDESRRLERIGVPSVVIACLEPSRVDRAHPGWLAATVSAAAGEPRGLDLICTTRVVGSEIEDVHQPGSPWWEAHVRWNPPGANAGASRP